MAMIAEGAENKKKDDEIAEKRKKQEEKKKWEGALRRLCARKLTVHRDSRGPCDGLAVVQQGRQRQRQEAQAGRLSRLILSSCNGSGCIQIGRAHV